MLHFYRKSVVYLSIFDKNWLIDYLIALFLLLSWVGYDFFHYFPINLKVPSSISTKGIESEVDSLSCGNVSELEDELTELETAISSYKSTVTSASTAISSSASTLSSLVPVLTNSKNTIDLVKQIVFGY